LILKGILDVEDARIAAKSGAAALVVSNPGGRQLDGAPSSISVLPAIADAVGSSIEILFDGGIRSGQDLMRAIAFGAGACLSGRAYLYGLGAGGQAGVARAIEILRNELDVSMALTGITSVADIDRRRSRGFRTRSLGRIKLVIARSESDEAIQFLPRLWIASWSLPSGRSLRAGPVGSQ